VAKPGTGKVVLVIDKYNVMWRRAAAEYREGGPFSAARRLSEGIRTLCCVALVLGAGSVEANSVRVTPKAGPGGSQFALQINIDDAKHTKPIDAWVGLGPDKGLAGETLVQGSFLVDLRRLRLPRPARGARKAHLCFLGLSQAPDWATARVILFLERARDGSWLIGARLWDDGRGRYLTAGRAALATPSSVRRARGAGGSSPMVRIDFEWGAATSPGARDGQFRLTRTVEDEPELLLERVDLDNGNQSLSYLRAGVVNSAHQRKHTRGKLYLDDFSLSRVYGLAVAARD
jgi:hypothetical protein